MTAELKRTEFEQKMYHNTEKLLKSYCEVVWNVQLSKEQLERKTEISDNDFNLFFASAHIEGVDYTDNALQEQAAITRKNMKMLEIIDRTIAMIRDKHPQGDVYYNILYYAFLSEKRLPTSIDVIKEVEKNTDITLSERSYFYKKRQAVECLSNVLWGYSSREFLNMFRV